MKGKKIGIPKSLIYYHYPELISTYFRKLGLEIVYSANSSKTLLLNALKYASDEECYSAKIFYGHVLDLIGKVDYLFLPRIQGLDKHFVNCPKFIGLPDVLKSVYPNLPKLLSPYMSRTKKHHRKFKLISSAFMIGFIFTKNPFKIFSAIINALKAHQRFLSKINWTKEQLFEWEREGSTINDCDRIKIAVIGHAYVLNDSFLSFNISQRLLQMNVNFVTSEEMPTSIINQQLENLHSILYFKEERKIVGTALYFLSSKTVDGILQIIPFPCGPTAVSSEIIMRYAKRVGTIPLIQLMVDDNTGEAGLVTRLEAFVNTLRRKKLRQYQENKELKRVPMKGETQCLILPLSLSIQNRKDVYQKQ